MIILKSCFIRKKYNCWQFLGRNHDGLDMIILILSNIGHMERSHLGSDLGCGLCLWLQEIQLLWDSLLWEDTNKISQNLGF